MARDNGALGLILYSDPADDGYMRGDVYPRGPWRSADAIQRGTVKYIFQHASDPLTPGWAATQEAERLTIAEATDLPQIPVVPQTPVVPRCQTVATSPRLPERAIRVAAPLALRLSRRTRAGEGSPQGAMRAQHPAHLQRHRHFGRHDVSG